MADKYTRIEGAFYLKSLPLKIAVLTAGLFACAGDQPDPTSQKQLPPRADTLVAIFAEIREAVLSKRADDFVEFLDLAEAERIAHIQKNHDAGYVEYYLARQLAAWPSPDTLNFEDLIFEPPYVRLALWGPGSEIGYQQERVHYTFLLFKQEHDRWKLSGLTSLEKERRDRFGTDVSYFETELPSKLRFPRLF